MLQQQTQQIQTRLLRSYKCNEFLLDEKYDFS